MGVVISGDWTKPGPAGFTRSTQAQESAGRRGDGRRRSENHRSEESRRFRPETAPDLLSPVQQTPASFTGATRAGDFVQKPFLISCLLFNKRPHPSQERREQEISSRNPS